MARAHGITIKKHFGQHFLRDDRVVHAMMRAVTTMHTTRIIEIGGGDGFLTRALLQLPCAQLVTFEIDPEWAYHLDDTIKDPRFTVCQHDFLTYDLDLLVPQAPWYLMANLPYNITFPILYRLQQYRHMFDQGVIMIQEEVAQKLVKTQGSEYGYVSLYFQHYFALTLLDKVLPTAFLPPPKVYSRLVHFKTRATVPYIANEAEFWKFIKLCFKQPRRTLKNNLLSAHYPLHLVDASLLEKRAQQLDMAALLTIWQTLSI